MKRAGSGSVSLWQGSPGPDPHLNVTDPHNTAKRFKLFCRVGVRRCAAQAGKLPPNSSTCGRMGPPSTAAAFRSRTTPASSTPASATSSRSPSTRRTRPASSTSGQVTTWTYVVLHGSGFRYLVLHGSGLRWFYTDPDSSSFTRIRISVGTYTRIRVRQVLLHGSGFRQF